MKLQSWAINNLVIRALQRAEFSLIGVIGDRDRFKNLLAKISNTSEFTSVELSPTEAETLLEALLDEISTYTSVTVKTKTYRLKKTVQKPKPNSRRQRSNKAVA
jgi:hypothetical protein